MKEDLVIAGKYKLLRPIEKGGYANVWLAEEISGLRQSELALKLVFTPENQLGIAERRRKTMEHEKAIWTKLRRHEGVVQVFDYIEDNLLIDGCKYTILGFAMEYANSGDLRNCNETIRKYLKREKAEIKFLLAIAEAVKFGHSLGIIHCDIKPENILVFERDLEYIPKLMDFGISLCRDVREDVGQQAFTPEYCHPDLLTGTKQSADEETDVYSLGLLFYEIVVGKRAFELPSGLTGDEKFEYFKSVHTEVRLDSASLDQDHIQKRLSKLIRDIVFDKTEKKTLSVVRTLREIQNEIIFESKTQDVPDAYGLKGKWRWHPDLHEFIGYRLYYLFLNGTDPDRDLTLIKDRLKDIKLFSYCLHKVVGGYEYVIRVWASVLLQEEILNLLRWYESHGGRKSEVIIINRPIYFFGSPISKLVLPGKQADPIAYLADLLEVSKEDAIAAFLRHKAIIGRVDSRKSNAMRIFTVCSHEPRDRHRAADGLLGQIEDISKELVSKIKPLKKCTGLSIYLGHSVADGGAKILISYNISKYAYIKDIIASISAVSARRSLHYNSQLFSSSLIELPDGLEAQSDDGGLIARISTYLP